MPHRTACATPANGGPRCVRWLQGPVRLYCQSDAHERRVHFTAAGENVRQTALDGSRAGWQPTEIGAATTTKLLDHTGRLPDASEETITAVGTLPGFTGASAFKSTAAGSEAHWSVHGEGEVAGSRWACDDFDAGEREEGTLHQARTPASALS